MIWDLNGDNNSLYTYGEVKQKMCDNFYISTMSGQVFIFNYPISFEDSSWTMEFNIKVTSSPVISTNVCDTIPLVYH